MSTGVHQLALALVALSSAANSVNGLLLRSVEQAGEWQIVFYRSLSLALGLSVVYLLQHRRRAWTELRKLRPSGLLGSTAISLTNICFIWSIQHTTVANTMFVLGAIPFFTALLARTLLGERLARELWYAIGLAMLGVAIMMWDGLAAGSLFGNSLAVVTALGFAAFVVVLRHGRAANMLPIIILGALVSVAIALWQTGGAIRVPLRDAALVCLWGGVLSTTVQGLFAFGSRHVQGAELSLMTLLEFMLAPVWVLLVFAERPTALTVTGGVLVLGAVAGRAVRALAAPSRPGARRERG